MKENQEKREVIQLTYEQINNLREAIWFKDGSTFIYGTETYTRVKKINTSEYSDGESYEYIVQRMSDKKYFKFDWWEHDGGIFSDGENTLTEVFPYSETTLKFSDNPTFKTTKAITGNYNTTQELEKPLFVYVVYFNVNGMSPEKARRELGKLNELLNSKGLTHAPDYREKYQIIPVKDQPTKVQLLYPQPTILADDNFVTAMEKAFAIISERVDEIQYYHNLLKEDPE